MVAMVVPTPLRSAFQELEKLFGHKAYLLETVHGDIETLWSPQYSKSEDTVTSRPGQPVTDNKTVSENDSPPTKDINQISQTKFSEQ